MKTAMQELHDYLMRDYHGLESQNTQTSKLFKIAIAAVMSNIENIYLETETAQILEAWSAGKASVLDHREPQDAESYYKQTFDK